MGGVSHTVHNSSQNNTLVNFFGGKMQLNQSKQFKLHILLILFCLLVVSGASESIGRKNLKWSEHVGAKYDEERNIAKLKDYKAKTLRGVYADQFKFERGELGFDLNFDKQRSNEVIWNDDQQMDFVKRKDATKLSKPIVDKVQDNPRARISETLKNPEFRQHNAINSENVGKSEPILWSSKLKRWFSQLDARKDQTKSSERDNKISDGRKKRYTKIHRILKREANSSEPTIAPPTFVRPPPLPPPLPPPALLPPILLPPVPLPPVSANNTPSVPVCNGQMSCSNRCVANSTEWRTTIGVTCYCDSACYEIFQDCCSDYTQYCGEQKATNIYTKRFTWTCEPLGHYSSRPTCKIGEGLWMVTQCALDWPDDDVRSNCENPTTRPTKASNMSRYIPAITDNITFRNKFCAKCNPIDGNLEFWPVEIKTNVIPPEHYTFNEKMNFLLSNGAELPQNGPQLPKPNQPRRYCLKSTIVDSCPRNTSSEACKTGPVSLISSISAGKQFKNFDCALCNDPQGFHVCFPVILSVACQTTLPQKFSMNLDYAGIEENSRFSILSSSCNRGQTYDDKLQDCDEMFSPPTGNEDKIRVFAWFQPFEDSRFNESDFKTIMKQYFEVSERQLFNTSIENVRRFFSSIGFSSPGTLFHLVRSTLILTPEQSFDIFFKTEASAINLGSFINFENPFGVTLNNVTYTIIKTTSRHLSCVRRKTYNSQEYDVSNERVYIKKSNIVYGKSDYYGEINGNITICETYTRSTCRIAHTGFAKSEFVINTNLSLVRKNTGELYEFGLYDVFNNSIALCDLAGDVTCVSEKSCAGRCSNRTEWRTEVKVRCSCDPDCYEVFNDCCSDYTNYCGAQTPRETLTKKYNFTCEDVGNYDSGRCILGDGLWMVTRCPLEWPRDDVRSKCEQPVNFLTISAPDLSRYTPVLDHDNTTFRNMYCAICHGVQTYQPWPVDIKALVVPPESYNLTEKIQFLLTHKADFLLNPGPNQARRYCLNEIIDSCPAGENSDMCTNGGTALVSKGRSNYKNKHCAACHGVPETEFACFPDELQQRCPFFTPQAFSLVLGQQNAESVVETRVTVRDEECGKSGIIFDDILQVCRVNWLSPPKQNQQERFYVFSWLQAPQNSQNVSTTEFQDSLAEYLNISRLQLFNIESQTVVRPTFPPTKPSKVLFHLVSSTILLTPQQSLDLLSNSNPSRLRNFIYFSEPFSLKINGVSYNVVKTTSRPLACVGKTTYSPEQYTLQSGERVYIASANKSYEKFEYFRENIEQLSEKRGNITVCEKFTPTECNGTIIVYTPEEYTLNENLTIFVLKTSSLYHYGEYEVLANKSLAICKVLVTNIITGARNTIRDNEALGWITFLFFLLSILFLIFLLVTYTLFPQLRTLPGKNLMNLAGSLLFFEIFWLPSSFTEVRFDKASCTTLASLEHYFLMASFVSMTIIAFHTCKVFAKQTMAPKISAGQERKLFLMYFGLVWFSPAVFVMILVVLDQRDVFEIGYGDSEICWLTENNSYTYFVTIPIALLLLFNIIAFAITAVHLREHGQNTAATHSSRKRQSNLSIYVKLSTLMGFTWLFGLLALLVTSTVVFWYFFVILTSLQGVFVAVAFVVNAKTLNLYRQSYKKHQNSSGTTPNTPNTTSRKLTTDVKVNDTKF